MNKPKFAPDWLPYVLPMAIFLGFTYIEGQVRDHYVWIYFAKIAVVVVALVFARSTWQDIKWEPRLLPLAFLSGIVLFAVWVGLEKWVTYPHLGDRIAYNPWSMIADQRLRFAFLAVRFFGLALVVPLMEELFWRSFGLRYASRPDFKSLPIGTFSLNGGAIVCVLFALSHPEWAPALVYAAAMALMVQRTKSVFVCFVSHVITNLALGIYVIATGAWVLW